DECWEEFMSGSFTGKLIDPDDNPTQSRDRIVVAKVVRPIAGRFWISSPWLADSRFETIEPDQGEFRTDIIPRLPSELAEAAEDAAGAAADGDGDSSDEASADLDELIEMGAEIGCDCSCEGKRRSQMLLTEMRSGTAPVSAEQFTLASCMSLCAAVYAGCP
ncbi:MAG: hypothetical protein KDI09_19730, partial [Halioglobus sp.]|nr:hypothetical protein [Halioglobus sp.]